MGPRWVVPTLRGYRVSWLGADALASLTLVAIALPSQMATARLADLPAVAGLYAFMAGTVLYALLGTRPQLSVGADSTIAPVLAVGVASLAVIGTARFDHTMALAALLVGAVLVVAGLCRMGWIAEFLSTPVIIGVLGGIAVEIIVRQLPVVLGEPGGGDTTISRLRAVVDQLGQINGWTVGIAVGVFTLMVVAQRVDPRLPGSLAGLVLSIIAVDVFGLAARGVKVLGTIHGGLPHLGLPPATWPEIRDLVGTVATVAFLCIAQTAATVRQLQSAPSPNSFDQDLVAIGAGSVAAGLIGVLAVDASPPNTAIVAASGTRSQLTNVFAAVIILIVVLTLTAPLAHLPEATLGATLVFIAAKLFRVRELRDILGYDRIEFALAASALVVVALVGIEQGVLVAFVLSLADRTRRSARPKDAVLGREPHTDHWIPTDIGYPTEQVAGVLVYLVHAPLWYGNADFVRGRILELVSAASTPVRAVVLDADGMSDIDYTGSAVLRRLSTDLARRGISVAMARGSHLVHRDLTRGAVLEHLGFGHLFVSVEAAVAALTGGPGPPQAPS